MKFLYPILYFNEQKESKFGRHTLDGFSAPTKFTLTTNNNHAKIVIRMLGFGVEFTWDLK